MNLALAVLVATTLRFENMLFLGVIAINTAIGIFQEVRSKNALEKLSLLGKSKYRVNRDGQTIEVAPEDIVLGNICISIWEIRYLSMQKSLKGILKLMSPCWLVRVIRSLKQQVTSWWAEAMSLAVLVWSRRRRSDPIVISTNSQNPARNSKNILLNCAITWIRF